MASEAFFVLAYDICTGCGAKGEVSRMIRQYDDGTEYEAGALCVSCLRDSIRDLETARAALVRFLEREGCD